MKTSVTMIRHLDVYNVEQRTKDGMFNATSLIKQWNESGNTKKDLDDFLNNANTKEFISALSEDIVVNQQLPNPQKNGELKTVNNKTVADTIINATRGRYGMTWMHPYLFIKFAMWLNPRFEVQVIKFVYDELMELRDAAGDGYKVMTAAVSIFPDVDYAYIATALNYIVFGKHYEGIRQTATIEQLKELKDIQSNLAFAVNRGFITSYQSLIIEMRKIWLEKYQQF